jgi:pimeloyl-ACP methyl ester carboxylesterase
MELFYRMHGEGEPLIILHGLLGSSDNWQNLAKRFSSSFRVYTPDLRNHGQSPHHDKMDFNVLNEDLLEFIQRMELSEINIIGHSLGGKTAMNFALKNPGSVKNLVIVDIGPWYYDVVHDRYIDSMLKLDLESFSRREEIDMAFSKDIANPVIRQFLLKNLKRDERGKFVWKINLDIIKRNLPDLGEPVVSEIPFPKPTLFIAGGKSEYVKPKDIGDIQSLFPAVKVVFFENAGHWVHADEPERFYKTVMEFLHENN